MGARPSSLAPSGLVRTLCGLRRRHDALTCTDTPCGGVDPDLLDGLVVEVLLEGAEASDGVDHRLGRCLGVEQWRDVPAERPFVVVRDRIAHECLEADRIPQRVDAAATDELAHLVLEQCDAFHRSPLWIPSIRTEWSIGDAGGSRGRLWTSMGTRRRPTPWAARAHRHPS